MFSGGNIPTAQYVAVTFIRCMCLEISKTCSLSQKGLFTHKRKNVKNVKPVVKKKNKSHISVNTTRLYEKKFYSGTAKHIYDTYDTDLQKRILCEYTGVNGKNIILAYVKL